MRVRGYMLTKIRIHEHDGHWPPPWSAQYIFLNADQTQLKTRAYSAVCSLFRPSCCHFLNAATV